MLGFPTGYVFYSIGGIGLAEGIVNSWNGLTGVVSVTTTQLPEGLNLYFTDVRAQTAVVVGSILSGDTTHAPSGDAVYTALGGKADTVHTHVATDVTDFISAVDAEFDTRFSTKTTDDLAEGATNKYYATSLFDTDFATKDTDDLAEGAVNLYYTDARARAAFTAGTNISISLAGVIDNTYTYTLPIATGATLGGVIVGSGLSIDGFGVLTALGAVTSVFGRTGAVTAQSGDYDTDLVTEGAINLYFTDSRARQAISVTAPLTYSNITGIIGIDQATTSTDGYLSSTDWNTFNGKQSALSIDDLTTSTTGVSIVGGTGAVIGAGTTIDIQTASGSQPGLLSSTDWNTFNGKQSALTFGSISSPNTAITVTSGTNSTVGPNVTIDIANASGSTNGLLTSTDWNTFNNKQSALTLGNLTSPTTGVSITGGTGAVVGSGAAISIQTASGSQPGLLSSTDWTTFNTVTTKNAGIQFRDEGSALGTQGTVDEIDFVGAGVIATRSTNKVTVTIAGGGGGGALQWVDGSPAPEALVENNIRVYSYTAGITQSLFALIKVPNTYSGAQIKMKLDSYSADTSGTNKVVTVATLIRQGTDTMSSTTNQKTTTTTITLSGGTANIPQAISSDLTDTSGQINSVAVSAGDYILVELKRDSSDTATGAMKIPVYGIEVTFV